ncbi:polyketide synthase protein [Rutstroemia sp. NJR-2017a WRK4]|nr:polyketide synthase protein [Rutstroemia sp. NJR-2017a WRK4]
MLVLYLEQRPEAFQNGLLRDLAYTLGQRRSNLSWKVAIPAQASCELIPELVSSTMTPLRAVTPPKLGFIFTGQGAQWYAMGKELMESYPTFSSTMFKIDECLNKLHAGFSLLEELGKNSSDSRISESHISQPSCTAIQIALVDLLASWNIKPSFVVGHSSGEIASAYAAGILTLESCVAIAYYRGLSILNLKLQQPDLEGRMLAVGCSPDEIRRLIKLLRRGRVDIACINSPTNITASGDRTAIEELQSLTEGKQLFSRKLYVDVAYHSYHMNSVAEEYHRLIRGIQLRPSSEVLFYSSLFGRAAKATELTSSYWVDNLTGTVKFAEAIQSMLMPTTKGGPIPAIDVFIEIGPHLALQGPLKQILKAAGSSCTKVSYAPSLVRNKNAVDCTLELAATLFMKGAHLDFKAINFPIASSKHPTVLTDLSPYPWNHKTRYWHKSRIAERHCHRQFARNDLVGTLADYSNDLEPTWRNIIRADDIPWVRDHKMQSMAVYPMSGYIAMALEAAKQRAQLRDVVFDSFSLREVTVARPLLIPEGIPIETNITFRAYTEGTRASSESWDEFRIFSWTSDRSWIEHCYGLITVVNGNDSNPVDGPSMPSRSDSRIDARKAVITSACTTAVEPSSMYDDTSKLGASYGPIFQGLESLFSSDNHAMAELIISNTTSVMPLEYETDFIIHPASLDLLIQLVWPIFGAGRTGLANFSMPSFIKKMSVSGNITRKPGDRLRAYGSGIPVPSHSLPTRFSLFATSVEEGSKPLIIIDDLVMTPINDGVATTLEKPRKLCYKLEWEPVQFENGPPNSLNGSLHTDSLSLQELDIAIICDKATWGPASELMKLLMEFHPRSIVMGPPNQVETNGKICIILLELQNPLIAQLDATKFDTLKKMIMSSDGVLWAVRGAYTDCNSPESHMVVGMARSIRSETLLKFATVDISLETPDDKAAVMVLDTFQQVFYIHSPDMEYQERCGRLMVPRVIEDTTMNEYVHRKITNSVAPTLQRYNQPGRPLKIAIQIPGALDSLHFVDDSIAGSALPEHTVEIHVRATSMNFKDIMISMGQLQSTYIGVECSGIFRAVGSKVIDLAVGDRVAAMTEGAYSTYARCLATSTYKIPDDMSFEDAATIPVIYCTAYNSLVDLARLCKGEKVLIHAAAGGVGQAAVLLCQMVGAEIFATVGSVAKKEHLMKEYGISEDHIFYSRDTSFAEAIKHATNGEGVDVVLNSLAGNALRETWECLAHFGRFIEIGKRDIVSNSRLEMSTFEHNVMFASVDLTVVAAERPGTMKRLLAEVFGLLEQGKIRPVSPITIFSMENVETAFRTLQAGKTMGKILVVPNDNDQIMVSVKVITYLSNC